MQMNDEKNYCLTDECCTTDECSPADEHCGSHLVKTVSTTLTLSDTIDAWKSVGGLGA